MAESWASAGELESLATAPAATPDNGPADMPDPEQPILERAQQILDELNGGKPFSAPVQSDLTDEQKLRFLGHVLKGLPYVEDYTLFGGAMVLRFETVGAVREQQLTQLVLWEEQEKLGTPANRDARYTNYLLGSALALCVVNGVSLPLRLAFTSYQQFRTDYWAWSAGLNREQYRAVLSCFEQFEQTLQRMLAKADDPSFWPTP